MAKDVAQVKGEPDPSPWTTRFADYRGSAIVLSVRFNEATRAILNASVTRDADCVYTTLLIGVGPTGPDSTPTQLTIEAGPSSIGRGQFVEWGFDKIDDLQVVQITAGR